MTKKRNMTENKELLDYIQHAKIIYSTDNNSIIGYVTRYGDGISKIRLHVCDADRNIMGMMEFKISEIDSEIKKLSNYVYLPCSELRTIKNAIITYCNQMPVIRCYENIGYQRDGRDDIVSYNGAWCYDNEGKQIMKDVYAALPQYCGNFKAVVAKLNPYMKKNVKRQIVLLHALSGAVCGLVKRNIILALVGESSKGKTTAMRMGTSFFGQPDYEKIALSWLATSNALVKRMDGLSGVNVLIDDTQLSKLETFQNIIYSLEGGESFDRLKSGGQLEKKCHWYVSIGITAEKSLVDTFKNNGAIGRITEMMIQDNDLFDNMSEVNEIKKLYRDNYGVVGTAFVQKLLEKHNESEIRQMVKGTANKAIKANKNRIDGDTVLIRHLDSDIAIMMVTAKLANKYLGFEFELQSIQNAMLDLCEENRRTFEQNKFGEYDVKEIYDDILALAENRYPQNKNGGKIIIPSSLMKECLKKYVSKFGAKAAEIKGKLAVRGYLKKFGTAYCKNFTIDGKSVSGYELNIRED